MRHSLSRTQSDPNSICLCLINVKLWLDKWTSTIPFEGLQGLQWLQGSDKV